MVTEHCEDGEGELLRRVRDIVGAEETLAVLSPGANYCKLTEMKYRNLRSGIRLEPLGPIHKG